MEAAEPIESDVSQFERLWRALRRLDGFGLFFIEAEGQRRLQVLAELSRRGGEAGAHPLLVPSSGEASRVLVDELLAGRHPPIDGGIVVDGDAIAWVEDGRLLRDLNVARDALDRLVRGPLIVVARPPAALRWQREAPDLFDVRVDALHLHASNQAEVVPSTRAFEPGWGDDPVGQWLLPLEEEGRRFLRDRGTSPEDVDDLVHEALVRILSASREGAAITSVPDAKLYFRSLLAGLLRSHRQTQARESAGSGTSVLEGNAEDLDIPLTHDLMYYVDTRLSSSERELFSLSFIEEKSNIEIANEKGLSVGTVSGLMARLRAKLRGHVPSRRLARR